MNLLFGGVDERRAPLQVEVRTGGVEVRQGSPDRPDLILDGPPDAVLGLLAGVLDAETARGLGTEIEGNVRRLASLGSPEFSGPVDAARPGPYEPSPAAAGPGAPPSPG